MMSLNENSHFNGSGRRRMLRIEGEYPWSEELIQMEIHMKKAYWHSRQIINQLQEVSDRTNMPITQENGQRIFGPPRDWNGPPPPKGCEVFVGKLPKIVFEPHLVPVFSKIGKIYEMRIMMDFSGTNRGYCFVQFQDAGAAHKAIRELNEYEIIPGRTIGVTKSVDNTRLFIRGIPNYKTEQEVMDEMCRLTDGVTKVIVIPKPKSRAANQGFAFVEYDCHKNAAMARRILIPGNITLWGQDVAVDWAEPEAENQITNLYVRNIDSRITERDLANIFNEASNNGVSRVKKLENYAFIAFDTHEQADAARLALDRTVIGGGKILVYWGKPSADNKAGAYNKPGMNDRWDTLTKGSNIDQDQRPKRTFSGSETSRGFRDMEKSSGFEMSTSIDRLGQQLYHLPVKGHLPDCIPPSPTTFSDSYSGPWQAASDTPSPRLQPQDLASLSGVSAGIGYIHSPIFQQILNSPNRSSCTSQFRGMMYPNFRP